ncbi:MAG: MBL fold metallo-hydrolase [Candidatus Diapherotrites archaeon]|nr:MBL fold metallo-hydrolase [Candidatus Diapherotrites archaeon]
MPSMLFLGTGGSSGVPDGTCDCEICAKAHDTNSRFFRTRSSALIENDGKFLLLDCGSDFWFQTVRWNVKRIDAVLLSHNHEDHMGGITNLRAYASTYKDERPPLPLYLRANELRELKSRFAFIFDNQIQTSKPKIDTRIIAHGDTMDLFGLKITVFDVSHPPEDALGFRINDLAYIPDVKEIPDKSLKLLEGIDTLVMMANSDKPYPKQMSIFEAAEVAKRRTLRTVLIACAILAVLGAWFFWGLIFGGRDLPKQPPMKVPGTLQQKQ